VTVASYRPSGTRYAVGAAAAFGQTVIKAGHMLYFFARVLISVPYTLRFYRREMLRTLSDVAWGNGSIVVGGGTVGVALILGITAGALTGIEGYNALNLLGLGPATGLLSSYGSTRELGPVMIGLAFTIQTGCRFTAQLGAMRIAEEIDAMEALAINPVPYLLTTRVLASVIASIPLFLASLAITYLACQFVAAISSGQSSGSYLHYFGLFISARDVAYATVKAVVFVFVTATIQCYFGYFASGGPQGVGIAAGRAMRASITVVIVLNTLLTMAIWGVDAGARFGG
jgi:phospholipid/cholesterol/gamma-HCH transport system permease protein